MPDSSSVLNGVVKTVLESTLEEIGGEPLDGSGFEQEVAVDLDAESTEEDAQ